MSSRADTVAARLKAADELAKALEPFGFFCEDEPDKDVDYAWMIRSGDRFKDWVDYYDIVKAREALATYRAALPDK